MNQDSDVSRLAAALNGPVIRYRNFGNGPTRAPQRPPVEPPDAEDAPRMRIYGDAALPAAEAAEPYYAEVLKLLTLVADSGAL